MAVLLVKSHRVVVVNEFAYYTRTTTVMEHIREDVLLVVIVAPAAYDIVADVLCERTIRIALDFFDIGKSELHYAASSKSSG